MTTDTMTRYFDFATDPGHGWLLVKPADLARAGLSEADISACSYRSPDGRLLALEEDCDAATFEAAWSARFGCFEIRDVSAETLGIRSWACFGRRAFGA